LKNLLLSAWLCILVCLSFSSRAIECTIDTIGLCTPTIEQIIEESSIETIEFQADGILTTTETTTTTTTTTVSNQDSNDLNIQIDYDIVGLPIPSQNIEFLLQPTRV